MKEKDWYQVKIVAERFDSSTIELLSYEMFELSAVGVEVEYAHDYLANNENLFGELRESLPEELLNKDVAILTYFEELDEEVLRHQIAQTLTRDPYDLTINHLVHENWEENWQVHYQPQRMTRFMSIVPIWEDYQPELAEMVVYLDPGLAFGTGNHPTTQLGIQALEVLMRGEETVLDVGTGSGILSFVAGKYGARRVVGYDLDPQAVDSARRNLQHQKPSLLAQTEFEFHVNDLLKDVKETPDIIVANILPHILVNMLEDAYRLLPKGGYLILGGILKEKGPDIEQSLAKDRWEILQTTYLGDWVGYSVQKKG